MTLRLISLKSGILLVTSIGVLVAFWVIYGYGLITIPSWILAVALLLIGLSLVYFALRPTSALSSPVSVAASPESSTVKPTPPYTLTYQELIDLFKHWDTRVSHHGEYLCTYYGSAFSWRTGRLGTYPDTCCHRCCVGFGSHLRIVLANLAKELCVFQDNIFSSLKQLLTNFPSIVDEPKGWIGIARRLRVLGLPFLSTIWALTLLAKVIGQSPRLSLLELLAVGVPLLPAFIYTRRLWLDTPRVN